MYHTRSAACPELHEPMLAFVAAIQILFISLNLKVHVHAFFLKHAGLISTRTTKKSKRFIMHLIA